MNYNKILYFTVFVFAALLFTTQGNSQSLSDDCDLCKVGKPTLIGKEIHLALVDDTKMYSILMQRCAKKYNEAHPDKPVIIHYFQNSRDFCQSVRTTTVYYDLVILDISMPIAINGDRVAFFLRKDMKFTGPLIAATTETSYTGTVLGWQKLFNRVGDKIDNIDRLNTLMNQYVKQEIPDYSAPYVRRLPSSVFILDPACPKEIKPRETPRASPVITPKGTPTVMSVKRIPSFNIISSRGSSRSITPAGDPTLLPKKGFVIQT